MTQLKIKVTKEILERSKYCGFGAGPANENCAIALAVRDIFPLARIGSHFIDFFPHINGIPGFVLPEMVFEYISTFDKTDPRIRPSLPEIEFTIDIPDAVIEQISIDEIRPLLINHPTLELVEA